MRCSRTLLGAPMSTRSRQSDDAEAARAFIAQWDLRSVSLGILDCLQCGARARLCVCWKCIEGYRLRRAPPGTPHQNECMPLCTVCAEKRYLTDLIAHVLAGEE